MDSIIWVKNLKQRSMQFNVSSMEVLNGHVYGYTPISEFALRIVLMISCLQSRLLCQLIAVNKKKTPGTKIESFYFSFQPTIVDHLEPHWMVKWAATVTLICHVWRFPAIWASYWSVPRVPRVCETAGTREFPLAEVLSPFLFLECTVRPW